MLRTVSKVDRLEDYYASMKLDSISQINLHAAKYIIVYCHVKHYLKFTFRISNINHYSTEPGHTVRFKRIEDWNLDDL